MRASVLMALAVAAPVAAQEIDPSALPEWDVVAVAHRGLAPGLPENTMAAFEDVVARGLSVIEIDLRGTADGEVVVMHDETVDRTTDGTGAVAELTWTEVAALDAGSHAGEAFAGEGVPRYEDVLRFAKENGVVLLLDIKESPTLDREAIVRMTEVQDALLNVIGGVRSVEDLATFRALNPNIRLLGFIPDPGAIEPFAAAGIDIVRLWPQWVRGEDSERRGAITGACAGRAGCLVEQVHALGLPVWSTTNEAGYDELLTLMQLGVNGFLTDVPDEMAALIADVEAARGSR